jgi:nitrite reductase (NADH) large subunit
LHGGRIYGLVAPGYTMASVAAKVLCGEQEESFIGADLSTKLKLMDVDVAAFGDGFAKTPGSKEMSFLDPVNGIYKKLVLSEDGNQLLGGILVGDAKEYSTLVTTMREGIALPEHPEDLILPEREGAKATGLGIASLPASAQICSCHDVCKSTLSEAIRGEEICDIATLKKCTKAGTGCGGCVPLLTDLLKFEMKQMGVAVNNHLCEHFPYSRQELYSLVRVHQIKTFDELIARHGSGRGCEICKPVAASVFASTWNEHILEKPHAPLQDTNDRYLANIQKDGTYSVVPRVPGGEITPEKLIVLGEVAKEFNLYTKITGGQRIDLFGAQLHELPMIWKRLVDAGFESGHAYGKALRTVKSCVGSTWCRYGVQDSVGLAIELEERYRGLRAPHKIKCAVSGCTRECAEAQSKDIGVIATENGWNLYVCGNGGMKPQHAVLLASDLDKATLIKYCDRFLMFYIRTADRLQRTATWLNNLEGGIDYLKQVVIGDSLHLADELEREMLYLVETYECEWKKAVENPEKLKQFRHFVNADAGDGNIVFVTERDQIRPATTGEKEQLTLRNFIPLQSVNHCYGKHELV